MSTSEDVAAAHIAATVIQKHEPRPWGCACGARFGDDIDQRWHLVNQAIHAAQDAQRPEVDRQTLAMLLADEVQTLDKDEEWYLADRILALTRLPLPAPRPVVDREALATLAADWRQSADEDERYLNTKVHASEVHDVEASIRINREHADAVLALLPTEETRR